MVILGACWACSCGEVLRSCPACFAMSALAPVLLEGLSGAGAVLQLRSCGAWPAQFWLTSLPRIRRPVGRKQILTMLMSKCLLYQKIRKCHVTCTQRDQLSRLLSPTPFSDMELSIRKNPQECKPGLGLAFHVRPPLTFKSRALCCPGPWHEETHPRSSRITWCSG